MLLKRRRGMPIPEERLIVKSCPFCGGAGSPLENIKDDGQHCWFVMCDDCCADGSIWPTEELAILAWNKRTY